MKWMVHPLYIHLAIGDMPGALDIILDEMIELSIRSIPN
jgi:hypothetical protein